MILESLVIYSCLKGSGCSESSSNYLNYNKEVAEQSKINVKYIEYYAGSTFIHLILPITKVISTREFEIPLTPHLFFYTNDKLNVKISLSKTF